MFTQGRQANFNRAGCPSVRPCKVLVCLKARVFFCVLNWVGAHSRVSLQVFLNSLVAFDPLSMFCVFDRHSVVADCSSFGKHFFRGLEMNV